MLRVEVEWIDSGETGEYGWQNKKQIVKSLDNVPVVSIGWLMHESPDQVVLTQTHDPKHDIHLSPIAIWRANIKSITVLRARETFDANTFFIKEQESEPRTEDRDTLPGSEDVRGDFPSLASPNVHWQNIAGSEDEVEDESVGHLQRILQRLGTGQ